MFNRWLSMQSITRRRMLVGLFAIFASTLVGCSSLPTTSGSWVGPISTKTLYDNNKECRVPVIHAVNGDSLNPSLGYTLVLVNQNYTALDAIDFPPGTYVRVTGEAGREQVTDSKGQFLNSEKGTPPMIEMYSLVRAKRITNMADGQEIKPRPAVATEPMPTTQGKLKR
jgi:hypothetical protein